MLGNDDLRKISQNLKMRIHIFCEIIVKRLLHQRQNMNVFMVFEIKTSQKSTINNLKKSKCIDIQVTIFIYDFK